MHKGRLEAFSDAVIAIILTVMVLELKQPHDASVSALRPLLPTFSSYLLSFVFLGIYWNNHHHLMQAAEKVNGAVLWANMHLLFWLSLTPFVTAWMGESGVPTKLGAPSVPVAAYGVILMLSGVAYFILSRALIRLHGSDSRMARALGKDFKGQISVVLYALAIGLAFVWPPASCIVYVSVACLWLIPDRRLEHHGEPGLPKPPANASG